MTDLIKVFLDFVRLSPRYFFPIWMFAGIMLFIPITILKRIGLGGCDKYRTCIGVIFLFSCCAILCYWLCKLAALARSSFKDWLVVHHGRAYLHKLTEEEKSILSNFITKRTRSQILDGNNGVVNCLAMNNVILRTGLTSHAGCMSPCVFDFVIQPWAWDYLNDKPDLLTCSRDLR